MTVTILTCLRCGHQWAQRFAKKPKNCGNPKCHSPYWDKPRKLIRRVAQTNAGESFMVTVGISFPSKVWARMNAMADEEYGGNRSALVAHVMEAWLAGQEQIPITIVEELDRR